MGRKGDVHVSKIARETSAEPNFPVLLDRAWRRMFAAECGLLKVVQIVQHGSGSAYKGGGYGTARTVVTRMLALQIAKLDEVRAMLVAAGRALDKNFRP